MASIRSDRRLKILFIPYWYPPRENQNSVSGAFVREHVMASALTDDVRVLAFRMEEDGYSPTARSFYVDEGIEVLDVTVHSGKRSVFRSARLGALWIRYLAEALIRWGRPDLIHSQDMSSFYAARTAGILGVPHVVSQHWTGFMRRALTPRLTELFRRTLPGAKLVLCSNRDAEDDLLAYGIRAETTWLPNSYDPAVFYREPRVHREESLLHVSGFSDQKRVPDILTAFRDALPKRPGAVLHLAGDGEGRDGMEKMACDLLPEGSFVFHGFLSKSELADLMRKTSGFVFPSSAETFGCVLMEAMACGCPVLTTRAGGIPAVVREGEGLFVQVGDTAAIADGMIRMLDGSHGLDTDEIARGVEERFSRPVIAGILHAHHLRAVTGESPAGGPETSEP